MVDLIFNFSKLIIGIICLIVGLKMAITGEWGFRFTKTEDWSAKNPKRRRKKVKGQNISNWAGKALDPESDENIIQHEFDHLNQLPKDLRKDAVVDIVFLQQDGILNNIPFAGIAWYDTSKATKEQMAMSMSNPKSLGDTDIAYARKYAKETGDKEFEQKIEDRIASRGTHGRPGE